MVFVDALGARQLEELGGGGRLPYTRPLRGILGYSCAALPSLLTGRPQSAHGRMCLFAKAERDGASVLAPLSWLGLLPAVVHERAVVRRLLARGLRRWAGLEGYVDLYRVPPDAFRWLDLPEREDLFSSDEIGGQPTFLSRARHAGLTVFSARWQLPEDERWQEAEAALGARPPELAFLYATAVDGALHRDGNGAPSVRAAFDRTLARIERAARLMRAGGRDVTLLVVGDHGMADVTRVIDPRPFAPPSGVRHFVDSTMLRLWGDGASLDRARAAIERLRWPGRWLDADALASRGAPTGDRFGQLVFLLDEGGIFAPSFLGGAVRGMHGYDVGCSSAASFVASDAPLPAHVTALDEIAPFVEARLGLPERTTSQGERHVAPA